MDTYYLLQKSGSVFKIMIESQPLQRWKIHHFDLANVEYQRLDGMHSTPITWGIWYKLYWLDLPGNSFNG